MPVFTLRHVKYRGILEIEQLDIPPGCITCIVGESGSGKTTLLRLLNHLISCDEGEIRVNNRPISQWDPIELRRQVVMMAQMPPVFKGTVKDNLLIGLRFSEKPLASDPQLQEALEKVRLHKSLSQDAASLSGGEKQRLALARVLLMEPSAFLLDEPSSALDEETTQFVMGQLANEVKTSQKTLVMVTHSKAVMQDFAEYIVEMEKGRVVAARRVRP